MRVVRSILIVSILPLLPASAFTQTGKDACHVYVVDVAKAKKSMKSSTGNEEADAKAMSAAETTFPEFYPIIGEEQLTTQHYPFPRRKLIITASVYYTDESMASHPEEGFDFSDGSMLLGITLSKTAKPDAISAAGAENAIVEVTYDKYTNMVRAKKYVTVRGRSYLIGIQCDCMANKRRKAN